MDTIKFTESQKYELQYLKYLLDESNNFGCSYSRFSRKGHVPLTRGRKLNDNFELTTEYIESFANLDRLFDRASKEAYMKAEEIEKYFITEMKSGKSFMYDYEIDFDVKYFARNKYANNNEMNNVPVYASDVAISYHTYKNESKYREERKHWQFNENHNMFQHREGHPLKHQFHTYLMHDLTEHSHLSFSDILAIDEIQIETNLLINHWYRLRKNSKK